MPQKQVIELYKTPVAYELRVSPRARHMRMAVQFDGKVVVTVPRGTGAEFISSVLQKKARWILGKLEFFRLRGPTLGRHKVSRREYKAEKEKARAFVHARLQYWNQFYNFQYGTVAIRNQKSRWGSCSRRGNLNFNYKLLHLPANAADYIIVHELCHLKEFNHSPAFWALVARTVPEYKKLRRDMKTGKV